MTTQKAFTAKMAEKGFPSELGSGKRKFYMGIGCQPKAIIGRTGGLGRFPLICIRACAKNMNQKPSPTPKQPGKLTMGTPTTKSLKLLRQLGSPPAVSSHWIPESNVGLTALKFLDVLTYGS